MASTKVLVDLDLNQNELQNPVLQNLASDPVSGSKEGRIWINTTTHKPMFYDGTNNKELGKEYTEGTGIDITNGVVSADLSASDIPDISATYVATNLLGANSGVATLGSDGKVPATQLPSYVDDVIETYIVSGATELTSGWLSLTDGGSALTPETGKIYVVLSSGAYQNKTYRWSGSTYVDISPATGSSAISVNNTALTATSGVVTWTISNTFGSVAALVQVFEISTNTQVMADVTVTSSNITIKMNSASDVAANTYRAIIIG